MSWLAWTVIGILGVNAIFFGVLLCIYLKDKQEDFGDEIKRTDRKV